MSECLSHRVHLLLHTLPDGLDTETGEDLADVVTDCSHRVDISLSQYLQSCHEQTILRLHIKCCDKPSSERFHQFQATILRDA